VKNDKKIQKTCTRKEKSKFLKTYFNSRRETQGRDEKEAEHPSGKVLQP
jgi:hypothetical protein